MTCPALEDRLFDEDCRSALLGRGDVPKDVADHLARCPACALAWSQAAAGGCRRRFVPFWVDVRRQRLPPSSAAVKVGKPSLAYMAPANQTDGRLRTNAPNDPAINPRMAPQTGRRLGSQDAGVISAHIPHATGTKHQIVIRG